MASTFNVEFSVPDDPAEIQACAAEALTEAAQAVGLRLTKRGAGELQYGPQVQWPFLVVLWRNLNGEKMRVSLQPGESGGTRVTISGAVARSKRSLAADPQHWTDALGEPASAARESRGRGHQPNTSGATPKATRAIRAHFVRRSRGTASVRAMYMI